MDHIESANRSQDATIDLRWVEDFDDLSVDDLRELPNEVQLGLDLSVFE